MPDSRPSQTRQEALRDGVVPAVAALSFHMRVGALESAVTPEGIWVVSRLPASTVGDPASQSLGVGGTYGKTFVSADEYGEVLLLDRSRSRVLRAFPLPGLPPQRLLVTGSAIFCERQGDGGLPDSMLCRIDRKTLDWKTRVFPSIIDSGFSPLPPDKYVPPNWSINKPFGHAVFQTIRSDGRGLVVTGEGITAHINPISLRIEKVA